MIERRQSLRQKSFLRGRVDFHNGRFSRDCMIRDLSNIGARVIFGDFADAAKIPDVVVLHIPQKNRAERALVTWRYNDEIGIAFSKVDLVASPPSRDLGIRVTRLESEIAAMRRLLKQMANKINAQ
jgi:hypothetical protein